MCMVCGRLFCPPGCPTSGGGEYNNHCSVCGEPIFVGDEYFRFEGRSFCEDCVLAMKVTAGDYYGN